MFSRINSAVATGIEGRPVYVETDMKRGLPGVYVVGLASTMVMESRERIKSAILNCGIEFPHTRITINLTPAYFRKNGSCLDLPMAIGILTSAGYIENNKCRKWGIVGELSLDGRVLGIDGLLPIILCLKKSGIKNIIIPHSNAAEAALIADVNIFPVHNLIECIELIRDESGYRPLELLDYEKIISKTSDVDFCEISGQEAAKRAITIAVAGRHGLLMVGNPGCGKTMLARRIPTIMPYMNKEELIETAIINSAVGWNNLDSELFIDRPFRNPHHSIGRAGLIGGGIIPMPGEISMAHNGILFLDEVCEFEQEKIESLRLPIEDKIITHTRNGVSYTFPCNFQLIMASNPCPCGFNGDPEHLCTCSEVQIDRYRKKLSGPITDRIDMKITMEKVTYNEISSEKNGTSSEIMRKQVEAARAFAIHCGRNMYNSEIHDKELNSFCRLGKKEDEFMNNAYTTLGLTPRSYVRTLKVARTIADLDATENLKVEHLAEALSYRISEGVTE